MWVMPSSHRLAPPLPPGASERLKNRLAAERPQLSLVVFDVHTLPNAAARLAISVSTHVVIPVRAGLDTVAEASVVAAGAIGCCATGAAPKILFVLIDTDANPALADAAGRELRAFAKTARFACSVVDTTIGRVPLSLGAARAGRSPPGFVAAALAVLAAL
ncbi:hypothetical protein LBMAG42_56490 [Deltaproteobacteria bacterium]|nr:hypothetical protein LBMAG42_56490 [Deltaproteobacteria bacterium]